MQRSLIDLAKPRGLRTLQPPQPPPWRDSESGELLALPYASAASL